MALSEAAFTDEDRTQKYENKYQYSEWTAFRSLFSGVSSIWALSCLDQFLGGRGLGEPDALG